MGFVSALGLMPLTEGCDVPIGKGVTSGAGGYQSWGET